MSSDSRSRYDTVVWLSKLIGVIVFFVGSISGAVWGVMDGLLDDSRAETAACQERLAEANSGCDSRVSAANEECDDRVDRESARLTAQLEACHDKILRRMGEREDAEVDR